MASALTLRNTLQGKSLFLTDMFAPNMLYAVTIRSERPHARIIETLVPELPRDFSFLKAAAIPGVNCVDLFGDVAPILAERETRYLGEPIGLLVGPSPQRLMNVATQIRTTYEELDPVLGLEDGERLEVVAERVRERGNVDKALRDSSRLVEGTYQTGIQDHLSSEPAGAYAVADERGMVTVFSPTQWPYHVRKTVAEVLDIPAESCRVRTTEIGVHLDGKLWFPSVVAAHAALASVHTGKPVKLVYTREEDFRFSPKGIAVQVRCVTGLDAGGRIQAADISATVNLGAYPLLTDEILSRVAASLVAHYRCEASRIHIRGVRTNVPPLNACSGLGDAHAVFAIETHAARLTEITGASPVEWKRTNILRRGQTPLIGDTLSADRDQHGLLTHVAAASDFQRKFAAFELQKKRRHSFSELFDSPRGIGIGFGHHASGFAGRGEERVDSTVQVRLEKDGVGELLCGAVTEGDSTRSIWKQNLVSILNIPDADIQFRLPDTAHTTDCGPAILSRNITVIQRTIENACNAIKRRRFRTPLPIEIRRSHRLLRSGGWDSRTLSGQPYSSLSLAAAVVEVEVSPITYQPIIRGVWLAIDAGRILEREQARRVLERGVYNALEWAAAAELDFSDGGLSRSDYHRCQHSRLGSNAPIGIEFFGDNEKAPARGLGDLPLAAIPAAFAAAVTQATGRYVDRIPFTPETLRGYIDEGENDDDTSDGENP